MKVKTSELSGVQLDYAVAWSIDSGQPVVHITSETSFVEVNGEVYSPSTVWSDCCPLVCYVEHVSLQPGKLWAAVACGVFQYHKAETPAIAICRAVVAARLGDEVDIPDELMETMK